ncbi:MAG TPA: DUF6411 family protein [Thermoleophilaceae bacterium]|nr:DUF6411 family protein [Thermoleophilaceae bacterium]
MVIGAIVAVCIILLVLAFLLPRLSSHPQRGVDGVLEMGRRGGSKAPGPLGRWLQKPFGKSRKAVDKSASAGRRGRGKMPL